MPEITSTRPAADYNLLFGILALQMDFVSRNALIKGMNAWVLDKARSLGAILVEQGALPGEHHDLLETLVAAHLKLHDNDAEKSLAAIGIAEDARQDLQQIEDVDVQASLVQIPSTSPEDEDLHDNGISTVGQPTAAGLRFRILRPHALGGLGQVSVALDGELHREVALKEIQEKHADDPQRRSRFVLEAEITGGLEHPGVVPVYGLGQYADGRPYYAMRLVRGDSLKEAIECFHKADVAGREPGERALAFRQLLGRFVDVCQAVAYAHSRGVLHRDLKPGNVMLGNYGETLVVDWGLAKVVGSGQWVVDSEEMRGGAATVEPLLLPLSGSGVAATQMGSAVGTPAFMSPEQAAGRLDELGPASDVYSLGATLYCLLTGRVPFKGDDIGQILRAVQRGEYSPPRQVKGNVPPALEAVCLRAMALRANDRYSSAGALADDIEHWLADEPVQAYREPWTARTRRWVRRHRALAAGLGAAILVIVLLAGGYGLWLAQTRAEAAQQVETALDKAAKLLDQERYPDAREQARLARGILQGTWGHDELRERLDQLADDLDMVQALEEIRIRQADLKGGRFALEEADPEYAKAFRKHGVDIKRLSPEDSATKIRSSVIRKQLLAALDYWTHVRRKLENEKPGGWQKLLQLARLADTNEERNRLRAILAQNRVKLLKDWIAERDLARQPASTLVIVAAYLSQQGDLPGAIKVLQAGQVRHGSDLWINNDLGYCFVQLKPPQHAEAIRFLTAAKALRSLSPGILVNLGFALSEKGRLDEAIAEFREAIRLEKSYAEAHNNLGTALFEKGRLDEAIAEYHAAIRLKKCYAEAHTNLGNALHAKGRLDEAIAEHRKAIRLKNDFSMAHNNLGISLRIKGLLNEAISEYRLAIRFDKNNANAHTNLGLALYVKGHLDEAIKEHREAIRLKEDFAEAHHNLGFSLIETRSLDEAIVELRKAVRLKIGFSQAHNNLGRALHAKKQFDEAILEYRAAIRLKKDFVEAHLNLGVVLSDMRRLNQAIAVFRNVIRLKKDHAVAHYNLGNAFLSMGRLDDAVSAYRETIRHKTDYAEAHCNLAQALQSKGEFTQALSYWRAGHALGSKTAGWKYPSAQWVRRCEGLVDLERRLPAILEGRAKPRDSIEYFEFGIMCQLKRLFATAASFYQEAFARYPRLAEDLAAGNRYNAVCAAALAGCGQGQDGAKLKEEERARWRKQALVWLRSDLARWNYLLTTNVQAKAVVRQKLQQWQRDANLTGVRDAAGLDKLPAMERAEWAKLWVEVGGLVQSAGEGTKK